MHEAYPVTARGKKRSRRLRNKLILIFSVVIAVGFLLIAGAGMYLINNDIIRQAQEKVKLDLNSAREVYNGECKRVRLVNQLTAGRNTVREALLSGLSDEVIKELTRIMESEEVELMSLLDRNGKVIVRLNHPGIHGDVPEDEIVKKVIADGSTTVATRIVTGRDMEKEGDKFLSRLDNSVIGKEENASPEWTRKTGMVIQASSPVMDDQNRLIGILSCGILLNHNYTIVDTVKEIVFKDQKYKGKDIGTATIFQGPFRIATNVLDRHGNRALGTKVSEEVYQRVIVEGRSWIDRAFVVNEWCITAYEPIRNLHGHVIGMLYVGALEAPYRNMMNQVIFTFLMIAVLMVLVSWAVVYLSTSYIIGPLKKLSEATKLIARGDLSCRVSIDSSDEIGLLAESFNNMSEELEVSRDKVLMLNRTLEERVREKSLQLELAHNQLIQSEKLTAIGKLAAGIAHEINNPLTSILINSHLAVEALNETQSSIREDKLRLLRENMELIIEETSRCSVIVKELLEFSRQKAAVKQPCIVRDVIEKSLVLFENQFLISKISLEKELESAAVTIHADAVKLEQVFINVILNAFDAMNGGGKLTIDASLDQGQLVIRFSDDGAGIESQHLNRIFDPFFTTKGNRGTGLGLSLSYGIIQQHDGKIEVQSERGTGTTITIRLPLNESESDQSNIAKKVKQDEQNQNTGH